MYDNIMYDKKALLNFISKHVMILLLIDFFKEFIDKSRPALFKGLAKRSPAFQLWNDDYLKNHQGSDSYLVYVEPEKKENRTKEGKEVTFKKFIEIYHNESIYMVHGVPKIIQ